MHEGSGLWGKKKRYYPSNFCCELYVVENDEMHLITSTWSRPILFRVFFKYENNSSHFSISWHDCPRSFTESLINQIMPLMWTWRFGRSIICMVRWHQILNSVFRFWRLLNIKHYHIHFSSTYLFVQPHSLEEKFRYRIKDTSDVWRHGNALE